MSHPLLEQYPEQFVTVTKFDKDHPDLLSARRSRHMIATIAQQPEPVRRVFRKRFGRWFLHVPSLIAYLEQDDSLPSHAA